VGDVSEKRAAWERRVHRVRKKVKGTPERPRLCIYRSLRQIYVQIIDDTGGRTLSSASTLSKELKGSLKSGSNIEAAKQAGVLIAKKAKGKGIEKVVFDRNGNKYHGRVKALAESAREGGLEF